jgi:hypothetical protein
MQREPMRILAQELKSGLFIKDKIFPNVSHEVLDVQIKENEVHMTTMTHALNPKWNGHRATETCSFDEVFIVY